MQYNIKLIKKTIVSIIIIATIIIIQFFFGIAYVPTESMVPTIPKDSIVIIQKRNFTPKTNDICVYKSSSNIQIIHRIKSIKTENGEKIYTFKGDNNKSADTKAVSRSQIKAKYLWHSHVLGIIYKYIKPFVIVICSLLGIHFIRNDSKEKED